MTTPTSLRVSTSSVSVACPVCPICLDAIAERDRLQAKCGHVFHAACLFKWVIQDPVQYAKLRDYRHGYAPLTGTCPTCRQTCHQVFDLQACAYRTPPRRRISRLLWFV